MSHDMNEAQILAWLDQSDAQLTEDIRKFGVHLTYVGGGGCSRCGTGDGDGDDGPSFAYTTGLFGLGHPELLILGVGPETAGGVLNELSDRVRAGANFAPGELITFEDWPHRIIAEAVPNPGEIVFEANRFYQRPDEASVPVLQLSYDDKAGRFPWEEGYSHPEKQPRPGTFQA